MFGNDYVLKDFKNEYYWVKNIHYGYNWQNKAVLQAVFTDDVREAKLITWEEVRDLIQQFKDGTLVVGGRFKPDIDSLGRMGITFVSDEDMVYLQGNPVKPIITIPVEIKDDEQDS